MQYLHLWILAIKKQHDGREEEVNFEGVIGWVYLKF
jgi:hypothetical protein